MEQLNEIISTSSDALPRQQPEQKRPYISQKTRTLLQRKREAIENGDDDAEKKAQSRNQGKSLERQGSASYWRSWKK